MPFSKAMGKPQRATLTQQLMDSSMLYFMGLSERWLQQGIDEAEKSQKEIGAGPQSLVAFHLLCSPGQ